jgi:hypothetical protein
MTIAPWQLAIRFGLEVASLIALGRYAGVFFRGPWSPLAAWRVPGCGNPMTLALHSGAVLRRRHQERGRAVRPGQQQPVAFYGLREGHLHDDVRERALLQ